MTDSEKLTTNAEPVVAAQALLVHNITDQAILNYITKRWDLGASDAIAALAAARALLDDPTSRTALPPYDASHRSARSAIQPPHRFT
jgi:hypothetical protein